MRDYFKTVRCRRKFTRLDMNNKTARTIAKRELKKEYQKGNYNG